MFPDRGERHFYRETTKIVTSEGEKPTKPPVRCRWRVEGGEAQRPEDNVSKGLEQCGGDGEKSPKSKKTGWWGVGRCPKTEKCVWVN